MARKMPLCLTSFCREVKLGHRGLLALMARMAHRANRGRRVTLGQLALMVNRERRLLLRLGLRLRGPLVRRLV